ncbi:hypothetical protein os4_21160 [Comamonadaceae bacterium OS-4]|nr:hypothetical protein os4_21160 [Comamonadaceae bacterium OS-4]
MESVSLAIVPPKSRNQSPSRAGDNSVATNAVEAARVRAIADSLDCITDEDFQLIASITPGTAEAWRKRHQGPEYIRFGNRVLYKRTAVREHLETLTKKRITVSARGFL